MKKNLLAFIKHILDAIKDIEESIGNISKEEFVKNKDIKDANVRRLEIIGEAAANVPKSFRDKHSEIPWKEIVGTRDKMIHHYFGVNLDIVWDIINKNIPDLKQKILKIKEDLENQEKRWKNKK